MSKKKVRLKKQVSAPGRRGRDRYLRLGAATLIVALCLGTVLGFWRDSRGMRGLHALFAAPVPPAAIPSTNHPSKEYIYAGGKLIATEEPQPLAAPLNLTANTISSSQIDISWTASPVADHYQVERTPSITTAYTIVSANVSAASFTDNTVSSGSAYLYRVRAVNSIGNFSAPSNIDLATAITFSDDPLAAGSTPVRAQHLTELRQAVNAVRATANLSAASWTDSSPLGAVIKAIHIQELRTSLDEALNVLGLTAGQYTDSSLSGIAIKKVHIDEIRQRVK